MSEKENQVKIGVDYATGERLRLLSEKSGHSMAFILREFSKIVDFIPDNANRITLCFGLDAKTRQFKMAVLPMYVGVGDAELKQLIEECEKL